jgi:hypothetical protein
LDVDIKGMTVLLGMPLYGNDLPRQTAISLVKTTAACAQVGVNFGVIIEPGYMPWVRDGVLDEFLKSDKEKLFWIDADMIWEPADFFRMLAWSKMVDVVVSTYPQKQSKPENEFIVAMDDNPETYLGLVEIHGAGMGFTVWSRKACEALAEGKPIVTDTMAKRVCAEVFSIGSRDGLRCSEDMAVFYDLRQKGFKIWMDPSISLGHAGTKIWRGAVEDALKEKA